MSVKQNLSAMTAEIQALPPEARQKVNDMIWEIKAIMNRDHNTALMAIALIGLELQLEVEMEEEGRNRNV